MTHELLCSTFGFKQVKKHGRHERQLKKVGPGPGRSLGNTALGHLAHPLLIRPSSSQVPPELPSAHLA